MAATVLANAQELKSKPQYERMLKGEDAKKASEMELMIKELETTGKRDEAAKVAEELLNFRTKLQGIDHWQVRDVKLKIADLMRDQTPEQQKQLKEAERLHGSALLLEDKGKFDEAMTLVNKSIAIRKMVLGEQHRTYAQSLNLLAKIYGSQGNVKRAEPLYQDALRIRGEGLGELHPEYAQSLNNLALLYDSQGKYTRAEPLFKNSLRICMEVHGEMHGATATCLDNLAGVYESIGNYKLAESLNKDALRIRKEVVGEKHPAYAISLNNLAGVYENQSKFALAEPLYQDALRITKESYGTKHPDYATCLNNLASLYKSQGINTQAELLYQDALKIRKDYYGEKHPAYADSLDSLAILYKSQGKYTQAESLYLEAIQIRKEVLGEKHPDYGHSLHSLSLLYKSQGNYSKAEPLCLESHKIAKETLGIKHPSYSSSLMNLADLYESQQKYALAEQLYEECLRIRKEIFGEKHLYYAACLNGLADLYYLQKKFDKAELHFEQCLQIRKEVLGDKHSSYATCLNNMALLRKAQGDYKRAEPLYLESLRITRDALGEHHPHYAQSLNSLAYLYSLQGMHSKSESYLVDSIRSYEASRLTHAGAALRAVGTSDKNPYPLLAAVSANLNKPVQAYAAWEFNLARGLLDVQLKNPEELKRTAITSQLEAIDFRIRKLSTQTKLLNTEDSELKTVIAERVKLNNSLATLAAELSQLEVADMKTIQSAITVDVAIVSWVDVTDSTGKLQEHWACVLRNTGEPKWEKLLGTGVKDTWTKDDDNLPQRLRAAIVGNKDTIELARKLHVQRIAPIEKYLAGVKTLYVASVNQMAGIPVEVLTDKYTISYVPSGTYLARLKDRPKSMNMQILAVGDPIYSATFQKEWAELPGTRVELNRLQTMFGQDNVTVLTDDKATESGLEALRLSNKLKNYQYLHFATHSEANNFRAFDSNLILAHEKKSEKPFPEPNAPLIDAKLSAGEVLEYWKLDAELVTLSACETALGKSAGGDGLLGFAQAFLLAGARSVCLSLWKVDDTATALLMDRFYANLLGKREGLKAQMTKALALHEAKQWLRNLTEAEAKRKIAEIGVGVTRANRGKGVDLTIVDAKAEKPYANPKYWAGFILIGDPN